MSSLPSALRRSKEAWAAVGKPERARAVMRSDKGGLLDNVPVSQVTATMLTANLLRTDWRAIVPKKREAAGWPRYYIDPRDDTGLVLRSATEGDGVYYDKNGHKKASTGWWVPGTPERSGYAPTTATKFAEWLYDHGHTEAAYAIRVIWEPEGKLYPGDWFAASGDKSPRLLSAPCDGISGCILRRSRARRDLVAKVEGLLKELEGTK